MIKQIPLEHSNELFHIRASMVTISMAEISEAEEASIFLLFFASYKIKG